MADRSGIEWTDSTWNPVRGCARVSDGCRNCYAERVAARFCGAGQPYDGLVHATTRGWNGKVKLVPEALQVPWRWTRGRRIFVNSMSDLFHPDVPFDFIASVFWLMSVTTRHTYQILTKRPERMLQFFDWVEEESGIFPDDRIGEAAYECPELQGLVWEAATKTRGGYDNCGPAWPYRNVWIGVSVEDQAAADARVPLLLRCPAAVRWISAEPLLGPVDLRPWLARTKHPGPDGIFSDRTGIEGRLHWVVAGGESGVDARPMNPDWARSLRDQCNDVGVPFLFKQWGEWRPPQAGEQFNTAYGRAQRIPAFLVDPDAARVRCFYPQDDTAGRPESSAWKAMLRVGKRKAGRELDGVLHDAYPESRA